MQFCNCCPQYLSSYGLANDWSQLLQLLKPFDMLRHQKAFCNFLSIAVLSHKTLLLSLPIKFLLTEESRSCFQPVGQAISTALCFIPPSPADWMSMEKPSRRLDDTTTWEKPFVFSAAMAAFKFCRKQAVCNILIPSQLRQHVGSQSSEHIEQENKRNYKHKRHMEEG